MAQYKINPSSSPPQTLVVALPVPAPAISGVAWPGSPKAQGAQCKTDISYSNGGGDGNIFLRVVNSAGGVLASIIQSVAAGETGTVSLYFNMPASDIIIYAQVGVGTEVTDTDGPYTIEVLLTIVTTLTLALSTPSVDPGETVAFSGQLTRADAQPSGIRTIKVIDDMQGTVMATVSTDSNGNYSGSFTAPTTVGTYYYASEFAGVTLVTYTLAPSSSAPKSVAVGVNFALNIVAALATGITLLVASLYS